MLLESLHFSPSPPVVHCPFFWPRFAPFSLLPSIAGPSSLFGTLYLAATAAAMLAYLFSDFPVSNPNSKPVWRIWAGLALAAVYRASVQSSPIVPTVMDAGRARGSEEEFPLRRDLGLSCFYISYRLGFIASAGVIAAQRPAIVEDMFPLMLAAAIASTILTSVSSYAMPRELPKPRDPEKDAGPPPAVVSAREGWKDQLKVGLLKADPRLLSCYLEMFFFGIAFGQLGTVSATFLNDVVFNNAPGSWQGLRWAAYSVLVGRAIGLVVDALLPIIVFREKARKFRMTTAWAGGAFIGTAICVSLMFVDKKIPAMVLLGTLDVTESTHGLFSLLSAGSLVEPKYRATTFGVRAACSHTGVLLGSVAAGMVYQQTGGIRWVMLWSGICCFASGVAAIASGSIEQSNSAGVAANANVLISHTFKRLTGRV